ncbi:MAG TPA: hypothetical protein VGL86_00170, partial [Polyangia bacterium]
MRTISSVAVVLGVALALGSCSAVDNFGKFTVGSGSNDMAAAAGCTPGCDCIPADSTLGIPAHCRVTPLGGFDCLMTARAGADVEVPAGNYTLDSGASPPTLTDGSGTLVMSGAASGNTALFCVGSLTIDGGVHVTLTGGRAVAIVADSLIHQQNGSWSLGGGYASDENGAAGVGGGSNGGASGSAGDGDSAGKGGAGGPGTGGGGGGNVSPGAAGGAAMSGPGAAGGTAAAMPAGGFGGGGGGKGTMFGGGGGGGGGVLLLSASFAVQLDSVIFNATGGGGAGGGANGTGSSGMTGGGGGGG